GYAGVYSSFLRHCETAAARYGLSAVDIQDRPVRSRSRKRWRWDTLVFTPASCVTVKRRRRVMA
ncbi:hypothetical protein CQA18_27705, partial [Enterobacter hormaechei]